MFGWLYIAFSPYCAEKAAAASLPAIADLFVDIHYYFIYKSEKRQANFKDIHELFDVTQKKMLTHVCTRWLSVKRYFRNVHLKMKDIG